MPTAISLVPYLSLIWPDDGTLGSKGRQSGKAVRPDLSRRVPHGEVAAAAGRFALQLTGLSHPTAASNPHHS